MAVKLYVDPELVRNRMSLPDQADVNSAIESAIGASQLIIEGLLETKFDSVTDKVDTFFLDEDRHPVIPDGYFRLRLSQAFVKSGSVVVKAGDTLDDVSTTIASTEYKVDQAKGVVYVPEAYSKMYVSVTYNAGFDATNKIPDWLTEVIVSHVPTVINVQQISNRDDEATEVNKTHMQLSNTLLQTHMRGKAFHIYPLFKW